jgi:hypothetical protein
MKAKNTDADGAGPPLVGRASAFFAVTYLFEVSEGESSTATASVIPLIPDQSSPDEACEARLVGPV